MNYKEFGKFWRQESLRLPAASFLFRDCSQFSENFKRSQ